MDQPPPKSIPLSAKIAISLFILIHFIVIVVMNRPQTFASWLRAKTYASFSPATARILDSVPDHFFTYGRHAGLNIVWQMYSYLQRYDLTILAVGVDAKGNSILLPEPLQSPRTRFQQFFTDFRETKLQLNMYQYPTQYPYYTRYLLRRYRHITLIPIVDVRLELQYRRYVDSPDEAAHRGARFDGPEQVIPLYPFPPIATP